MKIAMIFDPYIPVPPILYGGTERSSSYIIEGLQALGHEVVVFASGNSTIDCEVVPCSPVDVDIKRGFSDEYVKQVEEQNVKNLLEREKEFDIIHWQARLSPLMVKFTTPILWTPHVTVKDYFTDLEKKLVKEVKHHVYFSAISHNYATINPDIPFLDVIHHGLPIDRFPFGDKPKGYMSFVGRYSMHKQPHLAMQAAIALNKPLKIAARLDAFGEVYFYEYCKPLLSNPLIENVGEVNDMQKKDIFMHADVNLHPISFEEPFGLAIVEAGLCGTPTIAFDKGSMRELIQDGESGYVVNNFEELLAVYPKAVALDRKKVRKHFEKFNYKKTAKHYAALYEKIIDHSLPNTTNTPEFGIAAIEN